MPLTTDFTFRYRDDGVILNTDPPGNFVDIQKVSGLDNAPFRLGERDREDMDGGFLDAEFEKMRVVVLEGIAYGNELFLDSIKGNFAPSKTVQPFYFTAPIVGERVLFVKSLGVKYDWEQLRRTGATAIQIQMQAEDPSIYGSLITDTAGLGGTSTGFGFDRAFNFGFGGTSSALNAVLVNNIGNKPADATFTIPGPITAPALQHDETGSKLSFNIDLATGDFLTVNLRNRTVRLNDQANRRNTLLNGSKWFLLQPGTNTIRFLGTSSGTPTLQISTRPAYR